MPATFTTELPDAEGLDIDASNAGELTPAWEGNLNNGEYRVQLRDDDPGGDHPDWGEAGEATLAYDATPLEHTFDGLLDGEQYSIRVRTETEHVDGEWLSAEEITKITAPDGVGFEDIGETSFTVTWADNADFDGSYQVFRKQADYDGDVTDDRNLHGTVADDDVSYGDEDVQPGREYEVVIRARTPWVHADSGIATVETDPIGLETRRVPSRGWHAEIELPNGHPREVPIADGAQWRPQINGLPRVSLPAPKDETWRDLEGQPLRVWYHGNRLPIDELESVTTEEGQTVLEGRGGLQLRRHVDVEFSSRAAHDAVQELIEEHTDYSANVDSPADADPIIDELMAAAETTGEWQDVLEAIDDDVPLRIAGGALEDLQVAWTVDAFDYSDASGTTTATDDIWPGGDAVALANEDDYVEWEFTPDHDIPEERVAAYVFMGPASGTEDDDTVGFEATLNGTTLVDVAAPAGIADPSWDNLADGIFGSSEWAGGALAAGETHTLRIEVDDESAGVTLGVGLAAPLDAGFEDQLTFQSPTNGEELPGPEHYPDAVSIETEDVETPFSVVAALLEVVMNDTSGSQKLEVSNDQGETWVEVSNTETLDEAFAEDGGTLRARFTLSRYGERTETTPQEGFNGQSIDSFELRADLEDTPVLVNQTFEGDLIDVIVEIADYANAISEARRDDGYSLEWTRAGQRTSQRSLDVTSYSDRKTIEDQTLACEVIGGRQTVSGERFTADDTTSFLSLANSDLINGTEFVYDPADNTPYERDQDYVIRNGDGEIRITDSGDMSTGTTYAIDYEFKPRARYEDPSWDGDATTERTEEIPSITTTRGCQQAALRVVQETSTALNEVEIEFANIDPDQSLVEAINPEILPGDEYYEAREIDFEGAQGRGVFADRRSFSETVDGIRSQIDAVARRS